MAQQSSNIPNVPKALYVLMAMQFAVGGALIPFMSLVLKEKGLTLEQISWIFVAASATNLIFPFFWGLLADRILPLNRLFVILNVAACAFLLVFSTANTYFAFVVTYTLFYAFFHPTLSLINALCFHHMSQPDDQFGKVRAWGSFGWIVPSIPIWYALHRYPEWDLSKTVTLALGLCVVATASSLFLPHTPSSHHHSREDSKKQLSYWRSATKLLQNHDYLVLLVSTFLMVGSFSTVIYYSPPHLVNLGLSREWIGPLQAFGVIPEIFLFPFLKTFIRKWNYAPCLIVGGLCLTVRQGLFAYSDHLFILAGSYLLVGLMVIFYLIISSILANRLATDEIRATAQSLLILFGPGCGPIFSNWVAGRLAEAFQEATSPIFQFAAVQALLATAIIVFRFKGLNAIRST